MHPGRFQWWYYVKDRLNIGVAGAFSNSSIKNPDYRDYLQGLTTASLDGLELRYGYVGILVEPFLWARSPIHVKFPVLVGLGTVAYSYPSSSTNSNTTDKSRIRTDGQGYMVIEPGMELEVSIIRSLRIGVGGSYIHTSDLDLPSTSPDALRNFAARLSLTYAIQSGDRHRDIPF